MVSETFNFQRKAEGMDVYYILSWGLLLIFTLGLIILEFGFDIEAAVDRYCNNKFLWKFANERLLLETQNKIFKNIDFKMSENKIARSTILDKINRLKNKDKGFAIRIDYNKYDCDILIIRNGYIKIRRKFYY